MCATGCRDGSLKLSHLDARGVLSPARTLGASKAALSSVALSDDASVVVAGGWDNHLVAYRAQSGVRSRCGSSRARGPAPARAEGACPGAPGARGRARGLRVVRGRAGRRRRVGRLGRPFAARDLLARGGPPACARRGA